MGIFYRASFTWNNDRTTYLKIDSQESRNEDAHSKASIDIDECG